jgi:quinol monooxygenase YgiN
MMVVVRFKVQSQPDRVADVRSVLAEVVGASRGLDGVVSFDIGQDVTDETCFIATEVFDDRAALERQEELPEVEKAMGVFETALAAEPEATIFEVSSSAPWG